MIFLDTSAVYALADTADESHKTARATFEHLLKNGENFLIHNYIIIEAAALLQRRLRFSQARTFLREAGNFQILWVDKNLHGKAVEFFERKGKRDLSLVDCVSFCVMRQEGLKRAFAFDDDFAKEGFETVGAN